MKKFTLLLILLCPFLNLAQEKISYVDGQEILQKASEIVAEGNFEKSFEVLNQIHPKDSSYISSLVPKSFNLLNTGDYDEAVEVADEGLSRDSGVLDLSFHINKTVALINSEQLEKALQAVEEGLKDYPRNFNLWYNKGIILEKTDKIKKAVAAYQQTVLLNPAYAPPHLRLGNISYSQELTAQALMAINMYLVLNPDGTGSFEVLKSLNEMVRIKNPNSAKENLEISGNDAAFEELNLLLDNRLALNEQYKIDSKLDIALTKQNHLLLSQMASLEGDGFWSNIYAPLYNWVWNNNHFEEFTNVVSFSIENEDYKQIVKKDVEGLKSFRNSLLTQWQNILQSSSFKVLEEDRDLYFEYSDLRLEGIGKAEKGVLTGVWKFYNGDGLLSGEGAFNLEGERTGFWKWFNENEEVDETANYEKGILQGENKAFYENGRPRYVAIYDKDELHGTYLMYNKQGALLEKKIFNNGTLEGAYRSNFPVGELLKEFDIDYRDGLIEGKAYEYYANGAVFSEMSFTAGEKNGMEKRYNRDGSMFSEVNFENNKAQGLFTSYFANGNISERSTYKDDLFEGKHESFYQDGTLMSVGNMKKGRYDGIFKYFDKDGQLHYEYDYKNGEIIAYRFFDKAEEVLDSGKRRGGEFFYKSYSPHGQVTAEGLYDISGGRKGPWKFYSNSGILTAEGEYKEDKADGLYISYYETGEKFSESTYKMDTLQGYYRTFFPDGQMQSQGWYKDGAQHGEWRSYYPDGKLQAIKFYHKGDFHELQEFFGVDEKIKSTFLYNFGELMSETFFDSNGKLLEEIDHGKEGKYTIEVHHSNGELSYVTDYVNGIKHGRYLEYDHNGNKIEEGEYLNGEQSGTWTGYYPNGEKKRIVNFSRGELHGEMLGFFEDGQLELSDQYEFSLSTGESRYYHENGELSVLTAQAFGEEHGRKEFFDSSGRLELVRFYEHGRLIGYSYLDKDSKEIPMIPLSNETGIIRAYFDNGKISREMEYVKGNVVGAYKSYYYSGASKFDAVYKAGEYHGTVREFFPNGNLKSEKNYHYGTLHGPSKLYHENEELREETNYAYDIKHGKSATFDEQGLQLKQEQFFNGDIYGAEKM